MQGRYTGDATGSKAVLLLKTLIWFLKHEFE